MINPGRTWTRPAESLQQQRLGARLDRAVATAVAYTRRRLVPRLWWPFEVASDLPALWAHDTDREMPPYIAERNGSAVVEIVRQIRRRVIFQRFLVLAVRTIWLALLVTLALMLIRYVTLVPWSLVGAAVALLVFLAILYQRTHPITIWTVARLLDRHWHLNEQVATAVELAVNPSKLGLAPFQVYATLERLRAERDRHHLLPRPPWEEIQVAFAIGLMVAGLLFVAGPAERLIPPANPLSPETTTQVDLSELGITDPALAAQMEGAAVPLDPGEMPYDMTMGEYDLSGIDSETLRQAAELSARSAQELQQIAEALQDASVTSQAAQDIQSGNYEQAAQQISDLARSIDNLSPEARQDLAERLRQAGQDIQQMDPEMARRLEQSARALESRSDRAAAQGLEDLSQAIRETGQNVIPSSQLGEAMDQNGVGTEEMEQFGPGRDGEAEPGAGQQSALGEGQPGDYGFGQSESDLGIGATATGQPGQEASQGSGAGQGAGENSDEYTPSTNPNAQRIEVRQEQSEGPNAPRLGRSQPGAPDMITTGPGSTGPGSAPQGDQIISTGLDPNRVPRSLRSVVEGYFRGQK
jgi:hypothetical protein